MRFLAGYNRLKTLKLTRPLIHISFFKKDFECEPQNPWCFSAKEAKILDKNHLWTEYVLLIET